MAQTAKALAENALLVRLKELEAYTDLAGKVGQLNWCSHRALPQLAVEDIGRGPPAGRPRRADPVVLASLLARHYWGITVLHPLGSWPSHSGCMVVESKIDAS